MRQLTGSHRGCSASTVLRAVTIMMMLPAALLPAALLPAVLLPASPAWSQSPSSPQSTNTAQSTNTEQAPDTAPPWTEGRLLSLVLKRPAVRTVTDAPVTEARADRDAAAALPDPRFEVEREEEGDAREVTSVLAWRWPLDGRRGPLRAAAEAGLDAARGAARQESLEMRHRLREAYAAWATGRERLELLSTHGRRLAELERRARARAASGEDSGLSARRFALAALEARGTEARAAAEVERRKAAVLAWLPASPGEPPAPPGRHPRLPALPKAPTVTGDRLARRPDVARARARLEQLRHRAIALGRPPLEPEIALGWKRVEEGGLSADGPVVGFGLRLPFADGDRAERRAARARVGQAAALLQLTEAAARAEILGLERAYAGLRAEALAARETVAQAEAVSTAALAAFELGESAVTDLLETLRGVLSARLAALQLHAAALEAHRDLERALGRPLVAPFEDVPIDDPSPDTGATLPGGAR